MSDQRIVVGIDGSDCSRAVLVWALTEAHRSAGVVEVVAAHEEPDTLTGTHQPGLRYTATAAANLLADLLAAVRVQLGGPPVAVRTRIVSGDPAELLLKAAVGARCLVVGRGGEQLGSVGLRCVQDAPCPVEVVAGPERETSARSWPPWRP